MVLDSDWLNEINGLHLVFQMRGVRGVSQRVRARPIRRYEERLGEAGAEDHTVIQELGDLVGYVNICWSAHVPSEEEYKRVFNELHSLFRGEPFYEAA